MQSQVASGFLIFVFFAIAGFTPVAASNTTGASPAANAKKTIEYTMAYPGLLPDSPFYFLKMARDRVVSFLISDPLKRAEFDLLQADKRILGGVYLLNKNQEKANLALSTISKGQQYLKKALSDDEDAKKSGHDTSIFSAKVYLASQKQKEVLNGIARRVPKEELEFYDAIMKEQQVLINKAKILIEQNINKQ